jgi:hypothetical protein
VTKIRPTFICERDATCACSESTPFEFTIVGIKKHLSLSPALPVIVT